jgi:hypothetical protein
LSIAGISDEQHICVHIKLDRTIFLPAPLSSDPNSSVQEVTSRSSTAPGLQQDLLAQPDSASFAADEHDLLAQQDFVSSTVDAQGFPAQRDSALFPADEQQFDFAHAPGSTDVRQEDPEQHSEENFSVAQHLSDVVFSLEQPVPSVQHVLESQAPAEQQPVC